MIATVTRTPGTAQVSRRQLLRGSLGAALGVGLAATGLTLPDVPTPTVSAALPFEAYHDQTVEQHHNRSFDLIKRGYRITSLSMYDAPDNARYAAVWVKQPGQEISRMLYNATAAEYQAVFDAQNKAGCAPVLISATGDVGEQGRYAAVFVRNAPGPWIARHNLNRDEFDAQNNAAKAQKLIPRSVVIYSNGNYQNPNHLYGGVWHRNTTGAEWEYGVATTSEASAGVFGYHTRVFAAATYNRRILWLASNDSFGWSGEVWWRTPEEYQQAFDMHASRGLVPFSVAGSGSGSNARYAAVFVTQAGLAKLL